MSAFKSILQAIDVAIEEAKKDLWPAMETEWNRGFDTAVKRGLKRLRWLRNEVKSKSKEPPQGTNLNEYAAEVHKAMSKWWHDVHTGERIERNKGEMQMLIVSEIAEAMEGVRKGLMDDKLPHRTMEEVEMADALIRIFDYCAGHGLDLDGAYREKMAYNAQRADHKPENRALAGGKKF